MAHCGAGATEHGLAVGTEKLGNGHFASMVVDYVACEMRTGCLGLMQLRGDGGGGDKGFHFGRCSRGGGIATTFLGLWRKPRTVLATVRLLMSRGCSSRGGS